MADKVYSTCILRPVRKVLARICLNMQIFNMQTKQTQPQHACLPRIADVDVDVNVDLWTYIDWVG